MNQSISRTGRHAEAWGFTLIEVVAALVIFASGVLVVLRLSSSISRQMEFAAVASEMVSEAEQRLDSLSSEAYGDLAVGETEDTAVVRGVVYERTVVITQYSPLLRQIELRMEPRSADAPAHTAYAWVADAW